RQGPPSWSSCLRQPASASSPSRGSACRPCDPSASRDTEAKPSPCSARRAPGAPRECRAFPAPAWKCAAASLPARSRYRTALRISPCGFNESTVDLSERAPLAVSRIARVRAALLYAHRAVLELRDLAEGIEHRIGQQVRSRLVEGERNEHRAARRACVRARIQGDLAAPRLDRDHDPLLD